jgi:hypothetical protein
VIARFIILGSSFIAMRFGEKGPQPYIFLARTLKEEVVPRAKLNIYLIIVAGTVMSSNVFLFLHYLTDSSRCMKLSDEDPV